MKVLVIYGSVRPARQGIRAARFFVREFQARGHETQLVDPAEVRLPLLEQRFSDYAEGEAPAVIADLAVRLQEAEAYVLVTAEYNFMPPPALLNLLDHFTGVYSRKPALLVSYSAGDFGGIRAVEHLRSKCSALGMVTVPAAVAIPRIGAAFSEDGQPSDVDAWARRADRAVADVAWYGEALQRARENG